MHQLLFVVAILSAAPPAIAQNSRQQPIDPGVTTVIQAHYFEAHRTGRGDSLKGVFLDEGRMMWVQDGQLRVRTSADYIAGFSGKPAPDESVR